MANGVSMRIEKSAPVEQQISQVKEEMKKELRRDNKKPKAVLTCSVILLVGICLVTATFLWMVAATGFVTIPLFSAVAYEPPAPTRTVVSEVTVEHLVREQVQTELTQRLQQGGGELQDTSITLDLPEASLTSTIQGLLVGAPSEMISGEAQIVVLEEGIELFAPLTSGNQTAVKALVDLGVEGESIRLEPTRVEVGRLSIPPFIVGAILGPFIQSQITEFDNALGGYMVITDIQTTDGVLSITGDLTVEVEVIEAL